MKENNFIEKKMREFEEANFRIPDEASARTFTGNYELVDWDKLKSFIILPE